MQTHRLIAHQGHPPAQVTGVEARVIGWDEARHTVLSAYHEFHPDMAEIARQSNGRHYFVENMRPGVVERAFIVPPQGQIGPITDAQRRQRIAVFQRHGVRALGVDPAANLAALDAASGLDRVTGFFTADSAARVAATYGPASVITARAARSTSWQATPGRTAS